MNHYIILAHYAGEGARGLMSFCSQEVAEAVLAETQRLHQVLIDSKSKFPDPFPDQDGWFSLVMIEHCPDTTIKNNLNRIVATMTDPLPF